MTPEELAENPQARIIRNIAQLKLLVAEDMKMVIAQARASMREEAARVAEIYPLALVRRHGREGIAAAIRALPE